MTSFKIVSSNGVYLKSIAFWDKRGNKFQLLNISTKFNQDLSVIFFEMSLLHRK